MGNTADRTYELQKILDMHRSSTPAPSLPTVGGEPVLVEDKHGGTTDLHGADHHTGTGEGSETRPPYPAVY